MYLKNIYFNISEIIFNTITLLDIITALLILMKINTI